MPGEKYDLIGRVKAIEREHTALRFTTDNVLRLLGEGGVGLEEDLKRLDINRASERLEGTYIIRLFSEFEVMLKAFLRKRKIKRIPRDAKPLINRVASYAKFSGPILDNAHVVREHRNKLVHNLVYGILESERITIRTVTSHLCTFLSRSLARWQFGIRIAVTRPEIAGAHPESIGNRAAAALQIPSNGPGEDV
jgi:hypothetical protein